MDKSRNSITRNDNNSLPCSSSSNDTFSSQEFSLEVDVISCPFCPYTHLNVEELENHVFTAHSDLIDCGLDTASQNLDFGCPLCPKTFPNSSELQLHVNKQHKDVLSSPKKFSNMDYTDEHTCPICTLCLGSYEQLSEHVESHFSAEGSSNIVENEFLEQKKNEREAQEKRELENLKTEYGMIECGNFREQSLTNMQKAVSSGQLAVSDFYEKQSEMKIAESLGVDDNNSRVPGVIPRIQEISAKCPNVANTLLCSDVDYYSTTFGDMGWGCGYRNLQILLSSLFRNENYKKILLEQLNYKSGLHLMSSSVPMPSINKLQEMIEKAWNQGFDAQGRDQLGGKLRNTRKWIGATEIVTVLSSMKFRCQLIDIHKPSVNGSHTMLLDWIVNYFKKPDSFKPPLYLQHQGHSRTVVGVEILKNGIVILLILDPSTGCKKITEMLNNRNSGYSLKFIRQSLNDLKCKQYQITAVVGLIDSNAEYETSKILRSLKLS